ncbi:MAG: hypothetical protein DRH30_02615 [Deltaproteobacteria bacterium]|nr:MAG: hypothetical protein DRH30_02615 [Deltaproteobacteria bacterium]
MDGAEQYVTPEANYAAQMDSASGVRGTDPGMAPYPLYGIPGMGETQTDQIPFWKKPLYSYPAGIALGFGLGWAFFGWFKPKYMKKNTGKRKKKTAAEGE